MSELSKLSDGLSLPVSLLPSDRPLPVGFTSYAPGRAVGGRTEARWGSDRSDDQWLRVDLGAQHLVEPITLDWERAQRRAYRIEVSIDGVDRLSVWSSTAGYGGLDTAQFAATSACCIGVHGLQHGTGWGYSLHEVGTHGS